MNFMQKGRIRIKYLSKWITFWPMFLPINPVSVERQSCFGRVFGCVARFSVDCFTSSFVVLMDSAIAVDFRFSIPKIHKKLILRRESLPFYRY